MPDLFANMRIKKPQKFFEYPQVEIMKESYLKYIEPVNDEDQNTVEKCWSFKKKNYEFTEDKKKEMLVHNINISPSDYEWVVDIFEKTAINDEKQGKDYLIQQFRKRASPEVSARVSEEAMKLIFDHCWKSQREQRKNRPFIREFWRY